MNMSLKSSGFRVGVIVFVTLIVYIPAMRAGFIWDDDLFVTQNPLIKADDGLYRFWFTAEAPDYFPLVSSSLWFEWRLWGMNPTGYHVVNVLWHAVISVLIWLVLRRLKIPGAWLAALVFAVHPVNVESVAWITERKNTQPMAFYLLTILLYLRFESDGRKQWYVFALCAFLLAILSKTSVVMLPLVLLGCAWWQRGRIARKDLVLSVPFFILAAVLGLVTVWFQYNVAIAGDIVRTGGFFSRLAGAGWAVWFYLWKAIIPSGLSFIYPRWNIDATAIVSYLPAMILFGCFAVFWRYRRGWGRPFLFGLGYYVVTLFPVLGFFDINFMRFSLVTDHWQYTSIIGLIAVVVGLGAWIWDRWQTKVRHFATILAVAVIGLLCVLTWVRCHAFKDLETLWRDTISKNPEAWMAHSNLGSILAGQGRFEEAISHCSTALRINPGHAWIHGALGVALSNLGRLEEAIQHFSEALRLKPDFVEAHNDLGLALSKQGRFKEAITHFSKALKIAPDFADAHCNLGLGLARQGRLEEAIQHFSEALRLKPDFMDAHYNLGLALILCGRGKEAIGHFSEALRLKPAFAEAHYNLGAVLASIGKLDEAITHFSEAVRIRPDFTEAKHSLSRARKEVRTSNKVLKPRTR
ncbi:MAG TPA: tetratricopeptide repeat protein [Desulfobacterales bacterium]|nr:tetratricopeptide repeat protein [Desulfobacterales bacterium]